MMQQTKPRIGTWAQLPKDEGERVENVKWAIGESHLLQFTQDEPMERQAQDGSGTFYTFFCIDKDGVSRKFHTQAWGLLRGLKSQSPLKNKYLLITKYADKGKQRYRVEEVQHNGIRMEVVQ